MSPSDANDDRDASAPEARHPSLRRNSFYNLAGSLVPLAIALITVPLYINLIGTARYGILAIVWMMLGYFGVFDLGLSRATAYHVSKQHDAPAAERESIFKTAVIVNLAFGLLGAVILYVIAAPLMAYVFKMPATLRPEVMAALPWLAASVPLGLLSGVMFGALEGRERFDIVNPLQMLGTLLFQIAPLLVAYFHGPDLAWLIPTAVLARTAPLILQYIAVKRFLPLGAGGGFDRTRLRALIGYGGWVSLIALIAPIQGSISSFIIASLLGAAAVAHFLVPARLLGRIVIIPSAITRSLFPRLTGQDKAAAASLSLRVTKLTIVLITPALVLATLLLYPFISVWINEPFAQVAAPIGVILALTAWNNFLARVPYTHLEASGRPDLIAKIHVAEIIVTIPVEWFFTSRMGLLGAALASVILTLLDAVLLYSFARIAIWRLTSLWIGTAWIVGAILFSRFEHSSPLVAYSFAAVYFFVCGLWAWASSPDLRQGLRQVLREVLSLRKRMHGARGKTSAAKSRT